MRIVDPAALHQLHDCWIRALHPHIIWPSRYQSHETSLHHWLARTCSLLGSGGRLPFVPTSIAI